MKIRRKNTLIEITTSGFGQLAIIAEVFGDKRSLIISYLTVQEAERLRDLLNEWLQDQGRSKI